MQNRVLKIIRNISKVISESIDRQVVLDEIAKILALRLDCQVCSIYIHDESTNELVLKSTFGLNPDSADKIRLKPGAGITGTSFVQNEIINVASPDKHPQYVFFADSGEEKYKSFLSIPLTAGGHCVGVLNLQRLAEKRFSPSVVDTVKSVCTQVANLILASRMLEVLAVDKKKVVVEARHPSRGQKVIKAVSSGAGVSIGRATIFERYDYFSEIMPEMLESSSKELLLLEYAIKMAKKETAELEAHAMKMISEADASIFNVHILFLEDKAFLDSIRDKISGQNFSIEYSIKIVNDEYQAKFSQLKDPVLREKSSDLKDVLLRLLAIVKSLRGREKGVEKYVRHENQIIVTTELLPSDIIKLPIENISGIICERGGTTAHIAILAKALNIPLMLGVRDLLKELSEDDEIIMDCHSGNLYIRPTAKIREQFEDIIKTGKTSKKLCDHAPAFTTDGERIIVRANLSLVSECPMLSTFGAEGIGLYRTEFLFMIRDHVPSEDDQAGVYSKIVAAAGENSVTMRILDIGSDKPLPYFNLPSEMNPALGWRGIRVMLEKRDMLKTQLKAILKVSSGAKLKILFPMVSVTSEVIEIKQVLSEVEYELHSRNIPHNENYQTGIMLEVPSAVIALDEILPYVDFMSIGSNDLLMYTFAADRTNEYVASKVKALHPTFLKLLALIGRKFRKHPDKGLAICGEMASHPYAAPFLIGAGIREFSMSMPQIHSVKKAIRAFSSTECESILEEAMAFDNMESVLFLVKQAFMDKGLENVD